MKRLATLLALAIAGCGAPQPRPVLEPPPPPTEEFSGAWRSVSATGPGSADVETIEMTFKGDGSYEGRAVMRGEGGVVANRGTYDRQPGSVTIRYENGRIRTFAVTWEGGRLILKDRRSEVRLEPVSLPALRGTDR